MAAGKGRPSNAGRSSGSNTVSKSAGLGGYPELSSDPLHILLFVLPLVVYYEFMLFFSDVSGIEDTVAAHEIINRVSSAFGSFALYLPGLLLIAVLLLMKIARGDAWRVKIGVIPVMAVESVAWAIPLLLIAALLSTTPAVQQAVNSEDVSPLTELSLRSRVALSIGAGLYEEMLFRLFLVSLLAIGLRNVFRQSDTVAAGLAIGLAALAFTFYHQPTSGVVPISRRIIYFVAGCFLGLVFVLRGFGIVVGAHAAYDLFVLVLIGSSGSDGSE